MKKQSNNKDNLYHHTIINYNKKEEIWIIINGEK